MIQISQFKLLITPQKIEQYNSLSKENTHLNRKIYQLEETIEFLHLEKREQFLTETHLISL